MDIFFCHQPYSHMASENKIKKTLDLLTTSPEFEIQSLNSDKRGHTESLREKVEQKNVLAIEVAEKISKVRKTRNPALAFYVRKKIGLEKLKANRVVAFCKEAMPTDIVALGDIMPEYSLMRNPAHNRKNAQLIQLGCIGYCLNS